MLFYTDLSNILKRFQILHISESQKENIMAHYLSGNHFIETLGRSQKNKGFILFAVVIDFLGKSILRPSGAL